MTNDPRKPKWAQRAAGADEASGAAPPYRKRRRWLAPLLILVAVAAVAAYLVLGREDALTGADPETAASAEPAEAREVVMQVLSTELHEVEAGELRETTRITGSLDPANKLEIPAEVAGRVDEVTLQPGDPVEQGQVLVRIDIETLTNQLEQQRASAEATRAQLELAQSEYERTQSLVNRGVASVSTLDSQAAQVRQLEANLAVQERQVANAEQSLEKATITAPFAGTVSERAVDPGTYVSPGTPLMTIVDLSSLTLEGVVPVIYAPRIRVGQTGEVSVDGLGDQVFTGTVDRVSPVAKAGTRMLPIYATVENSNSTLRGGMFASGVLILDAAEDAIGIPVAALREDDEGKYVLKVEGDQVVRQPVEVARTWDGGQVYQVTSGLAAGDVIVASALERLDPGTTITVIGN